VSCLDGVDVAITQRPGPRKARAGKRSVPAVTEVLLKGTCENCE
jgi:hypothetical protein